MFQVRTLGLAPLWAALRGGARRLWWRLALSRHRPRWTQRADVRTRLEAWDREVAYAHLVSVTASRLAGSHELLGSTHDAACACGWKGPEFNFTAHLEDVHRRSRQQALTKLSQSQHPQHAAP